MNLSESVSLDFNGILSKRHRSVWEISAKLIIFCGICMEIASICVWCVKLTDKLCMHVRLESSACGAFDPILQNIAWLDLKMRYNEIKHHLYWWVRYTQKKNNLIALIQANWDFFEWISWSLYEFCVLIFLRHFQPEHSIGYNISKSWHK